MTDLSIHNRMFDQIVLQYQDRIKYLKEKIQSQQNQIDTLNIHVELMTNQLSGKIYDV